MMNLNGQLVEDSSAAAHPLNRAMNYGDGVFETIRVSAGKVLFWEDHYFRLMSSMRILRMEIPMNFTPESLEQQIQQVVAESGKAAAHMVKILVWRKPGGKYTPESLEVEYLIHAEGIDQPFYTLDEAAYEIELFKDHYVLSGLLSTLKSNNRLISVLGSIYAKENDYQNCVLLNENKMVTEALNGNVFLVKGYKIKTPPLLDGCLKGIIRKQIVDIIGQLPDYVLEEETVSPFELQQADEMFITNTRVGIQPVSKYRKKQYENKVAREFLAKLNTRARLG
ncbi:aminotransferase class IV [Aureitalea marina]|uniref:branched-chain-amino-acid transaminase n=2 Tax=Aureitalea marina TaxID=930804 RepID=A0A2S7KTU6_9FLAO|nr:aminotransferase class IV [Aureitalea marina]PQB05978.1 aminotransferase class IV [Aureitalea marina]